MIADHPNQRPERLLELAWRYVVTNLAWCSFLVAGLPAMALLGYHASLGPGLTFVASMIVGGVAMYQDSRLNRRKQDIAESAENERRMAEIQREHEWWLKRGCEWTRKCPGLKLRVILEETEAGPQLTVQQLGTKGS